MNIIRFGEKSSGEYEAFVEYSDGTREPCSKSMIESLWWSWCVSEKAQREDADGFNIFGYRQD